jgi:hypothetical protein
VTTTLSLGVEVGVGELDGGDLVELGTESGVLLGDHEDVNAVDQRKNGERPSETHDTLVVSLNPCSCAMGKLTRETPGHSGTRESRGQ